MYYLLRSLTLGSPERVFRSGALTFPYALANVEVSSEDGVFLCRKGTNDIDLVNPGYEPALAGRLRELRPKTFVDIGAHVGKYTILVARQMAKGGRVVAVEPDPSNFPALVRNVDRNGLTNVSCVNVACWNEDGVVRLYEATSEDKGRHSTTLRVSGKFRMVPARTLDTIMAEQGMETVDVLKIDVEGSEAEVLKGARRTLRANPGLDVYFEAWGAEHLGRCTAILEPLGFRIEQISPLNYHAWRPRDVPGGHDVPS